MPEDNRGVSTVIGTILMVVLALIIAGLLIYWLLSFLEGFPENPIKGNPIIHLIFNMEKRI